MTLSVATQRSSGWSEMNCEGYARKWLGTILAFVWRDWGNPQGPLSGYPVSRPGFQPSTPWTEVHSFACSVSFHGSHECGSWNVMMECTERCDRFQQPLRRLAVLRSAPCRVWPCARSIMCRWRPCFVCYLSSTYHSALFLSSARLWVLLCTLKELCM
jgi:hypothetical protein